MYNPGVTDISGQLIAGGLSQGMNSFMQGLDAYKRKEEDDKKLLSQARATENFIKQHADLFGGEDKVSSLIATDPNESPSARYARLGQTMADTITGQKLASEQMQAKEAEQRTALLQQQAAAAQVHAQMMAQQNAQEAQARQHLQSLAQFSQGVGNGVYSPAAQRSMNMDLYGNADPMNVPAMPEQPAGTDNTTPGMRAAQMFALTNKVPTNQELMMDEARGERTSAGLREADLRATTRTAIEEAKRVADQAKLDAKAALPVFHDIPGTESKIAVVNGQPVVYHPPVPKDATEAMLDRMLERKQITPDEHAEGLKQLVEHRVSFSPNSAGVFADAIARGLGAQGASTPAPTTGAPAQPKQIFSRPAPSRGVSVPTVKTQAEYDALPPGSSYIGSDGLPATKRK